MAWTLLGTALAAAGSMALNEWSEAGLDARMERTRHRPVPAAEIAPRQALAVGLGLATVGLAMLASRVNLLAAGLGLTVVVVYLLVYTPLKTRTPACTLAGAVCGALPPMMGWAGAAGRLTAGAFLLGAVLFLWQIPHFLGLAWVHREDYERAGFRMLPVVDRDGDTTARMVVLYTLALLPVTLAATLIGMAGATFAVGAGILGGGLTLSALMLARTRDAREARALFLATLLYLPLLLGLMTVDRGPLAGQLAQGEHRSTVAGNSSSSGQP
jgi:protoheme IX farnesyltransferase